MAQSSFVERIAQRRSLGAQTPKDDQHQPAVLPSREPNNPVSRRATVSVPMPVAKTVAELLALLAGQHQLSPINVSSRPTKKELLAILESRTQEVLDAVNGHP